MKPPPLPSPPPDNSRTRVVLFCALGLIGVLVLIGVVAGLQVISKRASEQVAKRKASKEFADDMQKTVKDIQKDIRNSYDPDRGITNQEAAVEQLGRLESKLQEASRNLKGDEAVIMQAMASQLKRMQTAFAKYQKKLEAYTQGEVLHPKNLTDKSQIEPRRQIVRDFLKANDEFADVVKNSEKSIRADLAAGGLREKQIDSVILEFNSKAVTKNALNLQIRKCDKQIGETSIGILDLLETRWGKWKYDATEERLTFDADEANDAYGKFLDEMNAASEEEVKLQGKLVRMP